MEPLKNYLPQLSVIIPVYNAEKTLRQCVNSIFNQKFRDFELLLIDDGSNDSSPLICDEYAKQDVRVRVFHKENGGVSSARNIGIDYALGEWVTFIDSDDYITEGYFDEIVEHDEDLLISGYKKIDNIGIKGERKAEDLFRIKGFTSFLNHYITDSLLRGPVFKFYKKSLIGELRFLLDMRIGEDACFVFSYLAKCNCFAILSQGEYIVRLAEKPDEVKYAISVDYAVQSLSNLKDAFERLVLFHGVDKSQFLSYIGYYKRISQSDWKKSKTKWYGNKEVKAFYDYVWKELTLMQKSRLLLAWLLRR